MKLNKVEEIEVETGQSDRAGDNKRSFKGAKYIQIVQDGIRTLQEKGEG